MQTRGRMRFSGQTWLWLPALAWLLVAAGAQGQAVSPDVALVTKLSGAATYWNQEEPKQPAPVQGFMKVRLGDHLKLSGESTLTLLYFASGRQETWKGPVTLLAGPTESQVEGKKPASPPEVTVLPAKVGKKLDCAPLPLPRSSVRYAGAIQTMAPVCPVDTAEIKEAEKTYRSLRKQAAADDLTPELYYLGVLAEHQQFPEMDRLLNDMLARKPGDPTLKSLKAWARSQAAKHGRPAP